MARSWNDTSAGGGPRGRRENDITNHGRLAAGLCALSVALVFGGFGGTVAAADPETETDGSATDVDQLSGSQQETGQADIEPTATTPGPSLADAIPSLLGGFDGGTLLGIGNGEKGSGDAETDRLASPGLTGPMSIGVTTENQPSAPAPVEVDNDSGSDVEPAAAEPAAPEVVVSHSPAAEPAQEAVPPAEPAAPVEPAPAEQPADVPPTAAAEPAPLIGVAAPAGDISIPNIGDSLLAGSLVSEVRTHLALPMALRGGGHSVLRPSGESHAVSWQAAVPAIVANVSAGAVNDQHLSVALSDSILPEQLRSALRHTVGAFLAPMSLLVLAMMASPGMAGLVLLGAAGTVVGYRQARAAATLPVVGIARFVKSGPLGVVRSGGLIGLHPRRTLAADHKTVRQPRHRESVA